VAGQWSGSGVPLLLDHLLATYWVHYTTNCIAQSNAPEDGQNNCLKHVEVTGFINKQLLLHLGWLSSLLSIILSRIVVVVAVKS
jgi:hypothetical protein